MRFPLFPSPTADIGSFDKLVVHISGMRGSTEYVVERAGNSCELSFYSFVYVNGEKTSRLEESASIPTQKVLEVLEECGVGSWDGFHGTHPKGVRDGDQFELSVTSDGEKLVHADGSANFPKGYHELMSWLGETVRS